MNRFLRSSSLLVFAAALAFAGLDAAAQEPVGAISGGYVFDHADDRTGYANLHGWNAGVSYNLTKRTALLADFSNYYGRFHGNSQTVHTFLFGPSYSFKNKSRVTPSLFAIAGDARSSLAGVVVHAFEIGLGGSLTVKLNKHVSVKVIPAEYLLSFPQGSVRNSFKSAGGLEFPFGKR